MENTDPSKSAMGAPFIAAANALANMYKKAAAVEKDAHNAGARSAYMSVMQWAAQKSRRNEKVTTAEIIALCSAELVKIPAPAPSRAADDDSVPNSSAARPLPPPPPPYEGRQRAANANSGSQNSPGGDALVSDIRKLAVNPRKRPRICISETFIRACEDSGNGGLFSMGSARDSSPDRDRAVAIFGNSFDENDGRSGGTGNRNAADSSGGGRKLRSGRSGLEKQRRK